MPTPTGPRQRLSRRAKLQGVDYAVLSSGQQIPEYSSEDDSSEDDKSYGGGSSSKRKKRKRSARSDEFTGGSSRTTSMSSSNAAGSSNGAAKRKRKANVPDDCFICLKESRSPFMQCEICSRWCVGLCASTSCVDLELLVEQAKLLCVCVVILGTIIAAGSRSSLRPCSATRAATRWAQRKLPSHSLL